MFSELANMCTLKQHIYNTASSHTFINHSIQQHNTIFNFIFTDSQVFVSIIITSDNKDGADAVQDAKTFKMQTSVSGSCTGWE